MEPVCRAWWPQRPEQKNMIQPAFHGDPLNVAGRADCRMRSKAAAQRGGLSPGVGAGREEWLDAGYLMVLTWS